MNYALLTFPYVLIHNYIHDTAQTADHKSQNRS